MWCFAKLGWLIACMHGEGLCFGRNFHVYTHEIDQNCLDSLCDVAPHTWTFAAICTSVSNNNKKCQIKQTKCLVHLFSKLNLAITDHPVAAILEPAGLSLYQVTQTQSLVSQSPEALAQLHSFTDPFKSVLLSPHYLTSLQPIFLFPSQNEVWRCFLSPIQPDSFLVVTSFIISFFLG